MKRLKALFLSAQVGMLAFLPNIFAEDDLIFLKTKEYTSVIDIRGNENIDFDILIYDDAGLNNEEHNLLEQLLKEYRFKKNILYTIKNDKNYFNKMLTNGVNGIISHRIRGK